MQRLKPSTVRSSGEWKIAHPNVPFSRRTFRDVRFLNDVRSRPKADVRQCDWRVRFSNRPVWVKRFQAIHQYSVDVARGLVLLFGIGSTALPVWDSKTRRNNLRGGLTVRVTAGPSRHTTHLIHRPARDIISTARWRSGFLPIAFDPELFSCCCDFPDPAELATIDPHPVQNHGQAPGDRDDGSTYPAPLSHPHRPTPSATTIYCRG